MVNLVTQGVSARRVAAVAGLLGALSACSSLPEAIETPIEDRKKAAYIEVLLERIENGEIILKDQATSFLEPGMTNEKLELEGGPLPCFPQDQGHMLMDGRIQDATLMLMVVYQVDGVETPISMHGTGTVIRAERGINRVLTAAHVASPNVIISEGKPATLSAVHAFDAEGRLVVSLEPILSSASQINLEEFPHDIVHGDVMVLAPRAFPSPEMALSWQGRGLEVSPVQSSNLMVFHGEGGRSFLAPGYSGAALLDAQGRAVGLASEIMPILSSYEPAPNTIMPEAILNQDHDSTPLLGPLERELLKEAASAPSSGVMVDAVAGGPPLSSPRVLTALGVDPSGIEFVDALDTELLFSAGFPGRECRSSWLTYVPRADLPFLDRTKAHVITPLREPFVYTETPGNVMRLGDDGQVRPSRPQAGFGMTDFLSSIGALTRTALLDTPATNPFDAFKPEEDMEQPR